MTNAITLRNIHKRFGSRVITKNVSLEVPRHKMTAIIGRSGEGKSVLLKQIVGLIRPDKGTIVFDGIDITSLSREQLQEQFQKVGYVFQFAALLDSLTVQENIALGLIESSSYPKEKITPTVKHALELVGLAEKNLSKYPAELSGGMQKRVGLARALVTNPQIILYDEPTTGLDPISSRLIHELMFSMQQKLKLTSVVVSHDVEIFNYADYVALLYEGEIIWTGSAKTIWQEKNEYVHQFIRGLATGPIHDRT